MSKYIRRRDKFKKAKILFNISDKIVRIIPKSIRIKLFSSLKKGESLFRIGIRYILLKSVAKSCGDAVGVFSNVYIKNPQNLALGKNVTIQPMSYIEASGGITIGDDVSIAHGVTIMSETHVYSDPSLPFKDQGMIYKPVIIGEDTWIGTKVTILAGITIGKKVVIGANTVVTKDIPDFAVAVGNPARIIKYRGER